MIRVTLPVPPSGNRYWRHVHGRILVSAEARAYREAVGWLMKAHTPLTGPVAVTATIYRRWKRGDLDNFAKVLLDALQGAAFHDDAQVHESHRYLGDDKESPRVEVTVEPRPP